ncbi:MAG: hypothetical protein WD872_05365 [Pirellulaceae bacterium]
MKRSLSFVLAASSVLTLAAAAAAGDRRHNDSHQNRRPSWGNLADIFSDDHQHHDHDHHGHNRPQHDPIPLDPGRGDGRVPVQPVPPARDGYVFVNGHWERVKAQPSQRGPVVRDHRTPPVVRDHRTPPVVRDHRTTPVVRDHRTSVRGR